MALSFHPEPGVLVICDFSGFKAPEMVKRRPAVVISPRLRQRENLCTIVPLSTTAPRSVCNFHCRLRFDPRMPDPYGEEWMWVKADMVSAVSFARLSLPYEGRDLQGKRVYEVRKISDQDFQNVKACVLHALGMGHLTPNL